jgi:UDP-glucose 4-epimerase
MKKILLTGGLGYIGSHICVELLNKDYQVYVIDNLSNSSKKVLSQIEIITGRRLTFFENDIRDKHNLIKIFKKNSFDSVIHLAGLKSINDSVNNPLDYYNNNVISAISLFEVMSQAGCKSIIFSSSASVYGAPSILPITETCSLSTLNPYAETKLVIENLLQDMFISDSDWNISILRYFNPVGAHQSGLIGESPSGIPSNLFPYISKVAKGEFPKLTIFGNDYDTHDGTGIRDFIHVVDLAKGHLKSLEVMQSNSKVLVLNLGTGKGYSVLDVVKEFEVASNQTIPYEYVARRKGDVAQCYADASLAFKLLNWKTELNLSQMCQDTWNWEKFNRSL